MSGSWPGRDDASSGITIPEITRIKRNELFQAVEDGGLDPAECELIPLAGNPYVGSYLEPRVRELLRPHPPGQQLHGLRVPILKITHRPSGAFFGINAMADYLYGCESATDNEQTGQDDAEWPDIVIAAHQWAEDVRKEYVDPDLWDELKRGGEFLAAALHREGPDNTPFTVREQAEILTRVKQIKSYIRATHELTSEQMARVEERLDRIERDSRRLGRKDWLMAFNGAVFSLVLSELIPQQAATHIVVMAIIGLGHLFGIGSPPPSLPLG